MKYTYFLIMVLFVGIWAGCSPAADHPSQISGTLALSPELAASFSGFESVYVLARSEEGKRVALKKVSSATFPMGYLLGAEDLTDPDKRFEGYFYVSAFVDKDGRGELSARDLTGDYSRNPAEAGSRRVDILIDRLAE